VTFKAGDKVRYKNVSGYGCWAGLEGEVLGDTTPELTIAKITRSADGFSPDDRLNKVGSTGKFITENLELIEPAFTFADIQVGDKIRRTYTRDTGTTEVREGVVAMKDDLYATDTNPGKTSAINYILAYQSDGDPDKPQVVLELLDRPKPKHWTETKPVGSAAIYVDGMFSKTFRKTGEDEWTVVYPEDGFTFESKNQGLMTRFTGWDEAKLTWIR
jgi:hypothetical protein